MDDIDLNFLEGGWIAYTGASTQQLSEIPLDIGFYSEAPFPNAPMLEKMKPFHMPSEDQPKMIHDWQLVLRTLYRIKATTYHDFLVDKRTFLLLKSQNISSSSKPSIFATKDINWKEVNLSLTSTHL